MEPDVQGFLERFTAFGRAPGVETYLPLFHPEATLFDSGMPRPITVSEIPEHIEGILKLVPDFRMVPERWRARQGTLFVEAGNQASLGRDQAFWRSVYCVDLQGDRVIRGRRYYDRRGLYARLNPALPALPADPPVAETPPPLAAPPATPRDLVAACADWWARGEPESLQLLYREDGCLWSPEHSRALGRAEIPGHYASLRRLLPGLELELESWAGDDTLIFLEWRATAELAGQPLAFGLAERLDLATGHVLHGRAYFDTLEIASRLAAATKE